MTNLLKTGGIILSLFAVFTATAVSTNSTAPFSITSPFGAYDATVAITIQQSWISLLKKQLGNSTQVGKVTIQFCLNSNGSISDCKVLASSASHQLNQIAQQAIIQSGPFKPWTADMQRMIGGETMTITFTFSNQQ